MVDYVGTTHDTPLVYALELETLSLPLPNRD